MSDVTIISKTLSAAANGVFLPFVSCSEITLLIKTILLPPSISAI